MKYSPEKKFKSLFGKIEFELNGKDYVKEKIDYDLYNAILNMENNDKAAFDNVIIALIGQDEFDKNEPFNPVEVMLLIKWISETFFAPLKKMSGTEKNELKV